MATTIEETPFNDDDDDDNNDSRDFARPLFHLNPRYSYMGMDNEVSIDLEDDPESRQDSRTQSSVIDPGGTFYQVWLSVVTLAVVYNLYLIIGRAVFWELENLNPMLWFIIDYVCDGIYLIDMLIHSSTGYMSDGILVTDRCKILSHYLCSKTFAVNVLSILPTDALYLVLGTQCTICPCPVWVRFNRLFRFPRMREFFYITEVRTRCFVIFRIFELALYILVIIHWNACLYFFLSYIIGFGSDQWVYPNLEGQWSDISQQYVFSIYWSTEMLTSLSQDSHPSIKMEYIFMTFEFLLSVIIFATVIGNVTSIITSVYSRRNQFQYEMEELKDFFERRNVDRKLQNKVLKWCDYMYRKQKAFNESEMLARNLQDNLQAQVARNIHKEILQKMPLFKDAQDSILDQLVLKFRLQVLCPGDFVCRKGDIGKEMFILKSGTLRVVDSSDDDTYEKELQETKSFGDLCLVEGYGKKHGCKRIATVVSVGYSEICSLSKSDLSSVLDAYPEFRSELMKRAKAKLKHLGLLEEAIPTSAGIHLRPFY